MPGLHRALVAGAFVLAGCAAPATPPVAASPPAAAAPSSPAATATPSSVTPTSPASSVRPRRTESAPTEVAASLRFTTTTVDGRAFDGASLAGKPVLLWFWAPWCPTCKGQVAEVQAVARRYTDRVAVIGVGSLDSKNAIQSFADDAPGMTHLSDADGSVFRHFGVTEQSSFILLDARGAKVWSVGYGGSDDLADRVAAVAG